MNTFLHISSFIGSLGLFLYGMKIMSEGLEKLAGDHMRNILGAMTRNRFMGVLTGVGVTALINKILGLAEYTDAACDINGDGVVNVSDVTALIDIILKS